MPTTVVQGRAAVHGVENLKNSLPSGEPPQKPESPEATTVKIDGGFSLFSPYLVTSWPEDLRDAPDTNPRKDRKYLYNIILDSPKTTRPLSDDMLYRLRKELEAIYFEETACAARQTDEFRFGWSREHFMTMFSEHELREGHIGVSRPRGSMLQFLNKQIAVYFETSAQHPGYEDRRLGRYIAHLWYHMHDGRPPLQRHHYFGKAICFGERSFGCDIPDRRPKSIGRYILPFHKGLCNTLSAHLNDLVSFERYSNFEFWPMPGKGVLSWREHGFDLGHLFRAVFMVVDDQVLEEGTKDRSNANDGNTTEEWKRRPMRQPSEDTMAYTQRWTERLVRHYTVLLVKTGDDNHLSSPISFQSLHESGQTFTVSREDLRNCPESHVVRVKVDVALEFILNLIRKEEAALPELSRAAEALEEEQSLGCERWIDRVLKHAGEVGLDENGFTWMAIRRVRARLVGEAFQDQQVNFPGDHLGYSGAL